jgi:hypothetical protein
VANSGPWIIVHPGTGTIISLSDEVYIVDSQAIGPDDPEDEVGIIEAALKYGYRLDNHAAHNMYYVGEPYSQK